MNRYWRLGSGAWSATQHVQNIQLAGKRTKSTVTEKNGSKNKTVTFETAVLGNFLVSHERRVVRFIVLKALKSTQWLLRFQKGSFYSKALDWSPDLGQQRRSSFKTNIVLHTDAAADTAPSVRKAPFYHTPRTSHVIRPRTAHHPWAPQHPNTPEHGVVL